MGGKRSRDKGQRGEREAIAILQPVIDDVFFNTGIKTPVLKRNLMQPFEGGYDLIGLGWIALEVKRQERLNVNAWWKQALKQCKVGQEPVLMYRKNRQKWQVMMLVDIHHTGLQCAATLDIDCFLEYFKLRLQEEITKIT